MNIPDKRPTRHQETQIQWAALLAMLPSGENQETYLNEVDGIHNLLQTAQEVVCEFIEYNWGESAMSMSGKELEAIR